MNSVALVQQLPEQTRPSTRRHLHSVTDTPSQNVIAILSHTQQPEVQENGELTEEIASICERSDNRHLKPFGRLIRNQKSINATDSDGLTVLMMASFCGDATIVARVLEHPDREINEMDRNKFTALTWAARTNRIEIVRLLLDNEDLDLEYKNQGKKTLKETRDTEIKGLIKAAMQKKKAAMQR